VGAALAPGVVGQQGAGHPLGPARLAVLGAVGDVHHPEQVATPGDVVHRHQELAQEEVLVRGGPEDAVEDAATEEAAAGGSRVGEGARRRPSHERSMSR
jgi:hypothetical protein